MQEVRWREVGYKCQGSFDTNGHVSGKGMSIRLSVLNDEGFVDDGKDW